MRMPVLTRILAVGALLGAPVAARAQFTVYTDLASFLAATSHAGTDGFDDLVAGPVSTPLARSAGAFGYVATANTTDFYATGQGADAWLSTNTSTDVVTFSGFGSTVRGVGGFFFGTDLDGVFRPNTSLTLRATDAGGTTTWTLADAVVGSFVGFVSTGPITSLTVETVLPPNDLAWPTVNDLVLAEAASSTVPEPTTLPVLGAGVVALGLLVRRRRHSNDTGPRRSPGDRR
ncbi:MAG: PEP-CTERM sorting domain-containing protein [Gemmatirosa sp.]|nr:PEP-CTERM sorting domain-containing protein [Gemmatirosa sp.]